MTDGEAQLVKAAIRGDSSAYGALYDHYHQQIYRFVAVRLGRREDAEDVAHQVFLKAWQHLPRYRDEGHPFSSWLYKIARNEVIDFYRADRSYVPLEDAEESVATEKDQGAELESTLRLETVRAAIEKLPSDYQEVILLRFVNDLSVLETAKILKRSEGATRVLQHRAVKALREYLPFTEEPEELV